MKKQPSTLTVLFVFLLGFFLTTQAGLQGYVLCLCEDGHAALEYATNYTCDSGSGRQSQDCHSEDAFDSGAQQAPCGPCFDVPASYEAASRRLQDHPDLPVQSVTFNTAPASAKTVTFQDFTTKLYPQPPPRISQAILAHRTVVLLN